MTGRAPSTRRFHRFIKQQQEWSVPFTGHECRVLRKKMGYRMKEMAALLGCSTTVLAHNESKNVAFSPRLGARLRLIERLVDKALADLRDRVEMPNFKR